MFRCFSCDFLFAGPPPSKETEERYGKDYYRWIQEDFEPSRRIKRLTFDRWLGLLETFVKPGALLDVGCAFGFSLETARDRGWKPYGIEKSDYARAEAERLSGPGTVFPDLPSLPARLKFDAIVLFDVIEHLYDLDETLGRLNGLLGPRGMLAISTPNCKSSFARLMGRRWFHVKPLEHPFLLSPKAARSLLERHGFAVVRLQRAVKRMTLNYAAAQFRRYQFPMNGWVERIVRLLPFGIADIPLPVYSGEMLVFAKKAGTP